MLWERLNIDFGHELVTAIHTPLKWSNSRPSAEDFTVALTATTLSTTKVGGCQELVGGVGKSIRRCGVDM